MFKDKQESLLIRFAGPIIKLITFSLTRNDSMLISRAGDRYRLCVFVKTIENGAEELVDDLLNICV